MKFYCEKKELLNAVTAVQKAVSVKSTVPALEGFLIVANDDETLTITGYDLEIGIKGTIEATVYNKGALVINAKIFADMLRKFPEDTVYFESDEKLLCKIRCAESEFIILAIDAEDFPEMAQFNKEKKLTFPKPMLKKAIRQVIYAVSQSDQKPVLTGVLFNIRGTKMDIVALDGYRLALRRETITNDTGEYGFSFIVPAKALSELYKILNDEENDIGVSISQKHILFELDNFTLLSRLLNGEFLNYESTIPVDYNVSVECAVRPFVDCVERASLIINEKAKSHIKINVNNNTLSIKCTTSIGSVSDKIPVAHNGEEIEAGYNNKYLLDALKACECEAIVMETKSKISPLVIKPVNSDDFIFLVLPVRLKSE